MSLVGAKIEASHGPQDFVNLVDSSTSNVEVSKVKGAAGFYIDLQLHSLSPTRQNSPNLRRAKDAPLQLVGSTVLSE